MPKIAKGPITETKLVATNAATETAVCAQGQKGFAHGKQTSQYALGQHLGQSPRGDRRVFNEQPAGGEYAAR